MINNDKKYKYTKLLLKIAKEHGNYTNKDIAVKAGLSKNSVQMPSKWCTGKSLATERQMNYFITKYEHLLKRKLEHLFYCKKDGEELGFKKLTGEIIYKQQLKIKGRYEKDKQISALRLVIINNNLNFHVIKQYRAGIIDSKKSTPNLEKAFRSDNEDANWFYYSLEDNLDLEDMIQSFNQFKETLFTGKNLIDRVDADDHNNNRSSFSMSEIHPLTYIFYQKMMKLNLTSESFPF